MATVTYPYSNGTNPAGGSSTWTAANVPNAFNGVDDSYADCAGGGSNDPLVGTSLQTVRSSGTITKVEIGYEGYISSGTCAAHLIALFGGSVAGSDHTIGNLPTSDTDTIYWADITIDTNAPSTWTWADIQALDVKYYHGANSTKTVYIDGLYVRVTYTEAGGPFPHFLRRLLQGGMVGGVAIVAGAAWQKTAGGLFIAA